MTRLMNTISFFFLIVFGNIVFADTKIYTVGPDTCKTKEIIVPSSPFKIDLFCEDALGAYLGIVYRGLMSGVSDKKWQVGNRYWQDKKWSADVHSFSVLSDNNRVLISLSGIYGTPAIFQLNLKEKKSIKLYEPKNKNGEFIFELQNIDEKTGTVNFINILDKSGTGLKTQLRKTND